MTEAVPFETRIEVRWSDCDANQHMRHSAYADMCAHARVSFMEKHGMDGRWLHELQIGPVLFKEQTEYFREAYMSEVMTITVEPGEPTGSKKSVAVINKMYKPDGELAAVHQVVLGWMDVNKRKIVELPEQVHSSGLVAAAS